ncbi:MAG: acyl carrier protein [Clostridia bacterium]|nr:acyl carrier protein [Clostridia bacterium]MBR2877550.1 acyl carrier protein [Clostridia bacterium]MBR2972680.1 acyl carrier protein [Clostridia bacterium]MBR3575893.1 acyl carrier protein [Clostridia bacterium]
MFDKVKNIIMEQLDVEESMVTADTDIRESLGADSLDLVDLAMTIEDEFEVEITDDDIEAIKTVGDLVDFLNSK